MLCSTKFVDIKVASLIIEPQTQFKYFMRSDHLLLLVMGFFCLTANAQTFNEVSSQAGINLVHSNYTEKPKEPVDIAAGGAVADFNFDGYVDFYLLGGSNNHNALYQNNGDGTFINVAATAGVDLYDILGSGPIFADVDGDFDLDLLVFSINHWKDPVGTDINVLENRPRLFINQGDQTFSDATLTSGFYSGMPSYGGSLADLDKDGDLDLFMTHWSSDNATTSKQLFWENDGNGQFTDVTLTYLGIPQNANFNKWTFTPNVTDINNDGWLDVLMTSDFGTTRILYSNGILNNQLTFSVTQPAFITDENGMGSAIGDYDNDGDMDWFVSSIWDPDGIAEGNWGVTGNRFYRNTGNGVFEDATDETGVREGYWGWGSCFADFNNDGHLDIYHENGFPSPIIGVEFHEDPSRLFLANGDGTFTESSAAFGLDYTGQGRGVSCVDYDLDGDLDILVMPNNDGYKLYQNNLVNSNNHLAIRLFDTGSNPYATNSKITVHTLGMSQTRELRHDNNYLSNNSLTQHFGLATEAQTQSIQITWPDGVNQTLSTAIMANQTVSIGRYCHTTFMSFVNEGDAQPTTINLWLHELNGAPMDAHAVTMNITEGPHAGTSINTNTDVNGLAQFQLSFDGAGTDRLKFEFQANTQNQLCRALVKWNPADLIYEDDFEG